MTIRDNKAGQLRIVGTFVFYFLITALILVVFFLELYSPNDTLPDDSTTVQQPLKRFGITHITYSSHTEELVNSHVHEQPTPICLITTWENGPLPDYATGMFESITKNEGYVKMFVFHHQTNKQIRRYDHVEFIDIASIKPSYEEGGFPRFLADRLCSIHGVR